MYPFALFLDAIFMVSSDYQIFIDSKMQQYILYIGLYRRLTARRHLRFTAHYPIFSTRITTNEEH